MKHICILIATVLLAGCAAPKMNTASGRPEVTINATRAQVKTALASALVDKQWDIVSDSDLTLVAEHESSVAADLFFTNTLTGERPRNRVRFTFLEANGTTRMIAVPTFTSAPGWSGRTAESDIGNTQVYRELQWFLDCIGADVEKRERPPKPVRPVVDARSPKAN